MYQAAIEAGKENAFLWVAAGTAVFFIAQYALVEINVYVLDSIKDSRTGGLLEDRPLTSIKEYDRSGITEVLLSSFLELAPPLGGVIAAGFVRTMFVLKQPITLGNLFGGIKEMFVKIGRSFKDA